MLTVILKFENKKMAMLMTRWQPSSPSLVPTAVRHRDRDVMAADTTSRLLANLASLALAHGMVGGRGYCHWCPSPAEFGDYLQCYVPWMEEKSATEALFFAL